MDELFIAEKMIRFLKNSWRSLTKSKSSFVINLMGLSLSFSFVLVIALWVYDEWQVDKFHKWNKQLYQVLENHQTPAGVTTQAWTPDLLAQTLAEEMPEVKHAVAVMPAELLGDFTLSANNLTVKASGQYAEPAFFEVFTFELEQGRKDRVLNEPNNIVISRKLAQALFNSTENIEGKTVEWSLFNQSRIAVVSGIFEGTPSNSTLQFDFVLPYTSWLNFSNAIGRKVQWNNHAPCTYLVLNENTNIDRFGEKVTQLYHSKSGAEYVSMFAVPFSGRYLYGLYENGVQAGGRIEYVRLFIVIGLLILLIAGINFVNLTTASAFKRFKEAGVKKILGSGKKRLALQFIGETFLLGLFSLGISFLIMFLFLPQINQLTGKSLNSLINVYFIGSMVAVCIIASLGSGIYPAVFLTGIRPSEVLKVRDKVSAGSRSLRNGLVVIQFSISMVLVLAVLFVYRQIGFIQNMPLGYQKENVVLLPKEGALFGNSNAFLAALKQTPGIVNASASGGNLMASFSTTDDVNWSGKNTDDKTRFEMLAVDYDFLETMEIEMAEGRSFSEDFGMEGESIILNQSAVAAMGLQAPVTGQQISFWGKEKQIIGVCKDFHFESLHQQIRPLLIQYEPERTLNFMVRIESGKEVEALSEIEKLYADFNPGVTFEFEFLDLAYKSLYQAEQQVAAIAPFFAALGILLSCMGLFGLSVFAAGQRIREIGIRKVNGAKIFEILLMLNKDFIKWVIMACLLAYPLAWLAINHWLENFAYRTPLSWWIFALAGLLIVSVAVITVSWQSWRAATSNPVEALRYE